MIRKTIHYAGRVQGVGFRWTARDIAANFDVTGYVMNLPDGRVELVVEGDPAQVDAMLGDLAATMKSNIRNTQIDTGSATGQFSRFGIRQ